MERSIGSGDLIIVAACNGRKGRCSACRCERDRGREDRHWLVVCYCERECAKDARDVGGCLPGKELHFFGGGGEWIKSVLVAALPESSRVGEREREKTTPGRLVGKEKKEVGKGSCPLEVEVGVGRSCESESLKRSECIFPGRYRRLLDLASRMKGKEWKEKWNGVEEEKEKKEEKKWWEEDLIYLYPRVIGSHNSTAAKHISYSNTAKQARQAREADPDSPREAAGSTERESTGRLKGKERGKSGSGDRTLLSSLRVQYFFWVCQSASGQTLKVTRCPLFPRERLLQLSPLLCRSTPRRDPARSASILLSGDPRE